MMPTVQRSNDQNMSAKLIIHPAASSKRNQPLYVWVLSDKCSFWDLHQPKSSMPDQNTSTESQRKFMWSMHKSSIKRIKHPCSNRNSLHSSNFQVLRTQLGHYHLVLRQWSKSHGAQSFNDDLTERICTANILGNTTTNMLVPHSEQGLLAKWYLSVRKIHLSSPRFIL